MGITLMHPEYIKGMVTALHSQIRDRDRATAILTNYWKSRLALVWTLKEVHQAANEQNLALTPKEARQLLHKISQQCNRFKGWSWFDLVELIQESGLGRKLTSSELNQFLNKGSLIQAR